MEKRTLLRRYWWVVGIAVCAAVASRSPAELAIGDSAPALDVKEFVKGQPATIENGRIYVVEFWATWCGPCVASIPHLTDLQKRYRDVVFIGVTDEEADGVKAFVKKMGDQMDYRVALDRNAAPGKEDSMGKTSEAWLVAAGQTGIPTAFIVNRDRKVAWIGHPMHMDKVLEQVVAGTWDLQLAAKQAKLLRRLAAAQQEGNRASMLKLLDEAFAGDPRLEQTLGLQKFAMLAQDKDAAEKAQAYGKRLLGDVIADDQKALDNFAWIVVNPEASPKPSKALVQLALRAALRADELARGKDASIADTLARAYFESGDAKKAVATQERAIQLAQGTPLEEDAKARLAEYRKASQ